jgi:wyosine [tRNA(Phe)-imidazoG37] synthetase (radical SAM superfamily)
MEMKMIRIRDFLVEQARYGHQLHVETVPV